MTVGGDKAKNIRASEPNDDQRKLWKKQLNEARLRKANANKWYYATNHDQKEPEIPNPTIPAYHNENMNKSLAKDFSVENLNNKARFKADNYSSNNSRPNQKKEAIS